MMNMDGKMLLNTFVMYLWDNEKDCVTLFVLVASCVSRKYFTKIFDVSVVVGGGGWSH